MTEFSTVLRGFDRIEVDRLVERAATALASDDTTVRAAARAEIADRRFTVVLRGYDRVQVDDVLRRYADQLAPSTARTVDASDPGVDLLAEGPVTLFHRRTVLDSTVGRLRAARYQVDVLDAAVWTSAADMHTAVAAALDFPDYYGGNLDALNDCLRDVVALDYGWPPAAAGLVLVFTGFDGFTRRCPDVAQAVLDIVAVRSRGALLAGRRLIVLVHSDDAGIVFDPVGAMPVVWNDAEWSDAQRS